MAARSAVEPWGEEMVDEEEEAGGGFLLSLLLLLLLLLLLRSELVLMGVGVGFLVFCVVVGDVVVDGEAVDEATSPPPVSLVEVDAEALFAAEAC